MNLFAAEEARAMFEHVLSAVPVCSPPREPTVAMLRVNIPIGDTGKMASGCLLGEIWRAMYDAASAP